MIPRLFAGKPAKTLYARKSGKHNLDIFLFRRPLRAVPLRTAPLRHRLSVPEEPKQGAAAVGQVREAAEGDGAIADLQRALRRRAAAHGGRCAGLSAGAAPSAGDGRFYR